MKIRIVHTLRADLLLGDRIKNLYNNEAKYKNVIIYIFNLYY